MEETGSGIHASAIAGPHALMLEREDELASIADLLSRARDGRGSVGLVLAGAGLGKSTLLSRAADLANESEVSVLTARGDELEREMPFGIARQLFEPTVRRATESELSVLLGGAATHARSLLGLADDSGTADLLGIVHGLYWLLANLSDRSPVALLIDDLHWADPQTVRWLTYLSGRVAELPVLLLAAARPAEPGGEALVSRIAALPDACVFPLEPLGEVAVAELLRSHCGRASDEAFAVSCLNATGGNPFFVRELLRAVARDGLEPNAANARLVPGLGTAEIARSILVRLARLGAPATQLAEATAVLGADATLRQAAVLAGLGRDQALAAWDRLIRGEILQAGQPLEFIHPIARAAIYREMAPGERTRKHRQAAEIVKAGGAAPLRVAGHALACEPAGDQEVVAWLRAAAASATAEGAPDAAAHYLQRALDEPPTADIRPRLQFELGRALVGLDNARAGDAFSQASEATDGAAQLAALRWQAYALGYAGRLEASMAAYDRAIELLGADTEAARHLIGTREFYGAWWGEAPDRAQRRAHLRELAVSMDGATLGERQVLAASAIAAIHDGSMSATQMEKLAARLRGSELDWLERYADVTQGCAAIVQLICEAPAALAVWDDRAIPQCMNQGRMLELSFALACRAIIRFRQGSLLDGEASARTAWEIVSVEGEAAGVSYWWSAAALIELLIARGELDEATALLDAPGLSTRLPPIVIFPWPEALRGELMVARGQATEGAEILLRTGQWLEDRGFINPAYIPWRARVAPALAAIGRREEATTIIEPALRRARAFGAPWALGMALRAAGTVEQGDHGIELLNESVGVLERSSCRLEHAHAELELGASLRRANRRVQAREHLRTALEMAHSCHADPLRARAEQELAATGARPRHMVLSGLQSLTASERRVAELAATGASNPDIAQQLFVTRKTVETHLGHVYQKLGIHSRRQLPKALAGAEH